MPCYSRIRNTQTAMTEVSRLIEALSALKVNVMRQSDLEIVTAIGTFSRAKAGDAFVFGGTQTTLAPVGIEYGKAKLKAWAMRNRMSVASVVGQKVTLKRR